MILYFFEGGKSRFFRSSSVLSVTLMLLLSVLLLIRPAAAQEATVTDLVVSNSKEDLLVFFIVKDAFSPEMAEAVQNGLPITFTFRVEVYEENGGWWGDDRLAEVSIDRVLRYDSLKEEYSLNDGGGEARTVTTTSLQEAERMMSEVNGVRLMPVSRLRPGGDYKIRVKALLAKKELPFNMHYLIPFYSLWGFETDWQELSFRY